MVSFPFGRSVSSQPQSGSWPLAVSDSVSIQQLGPRFDSRPEVRFCVFMPDRSGDQLEAYWFDATWK
jgi:hypothetical protein